MLRYLTAGESHGPALTAIVEGFPSGVALDAEFINRELKRRQGGYGRGKRQTLETDRIIVDSGTYHGVTTGGADHAPPDQQRRQARTPPGARRAPRAATSTWPARSTTRPASARSSNAPAPARRPCGSPSGRWPSCCCASWGSRSSATSASWAGSTRRPLSFDLAVRDASPVYTLNPEADPAIVAAIDAAKAAGDTLGGIVEAVVTGCPIGLGSHAQWDRKLDARLALAVMSIQAIKAVEIGLGVEAARRPGLEGDGPDRATSRTTPPTTAGSASAGRPTTPAGSRGARPTASRSSSAPSKKPISTLAARGPSVNMATKAPQPAAYERSDVCAVPAASVIVENVVAFEIAAAVVEKYVGTSLAAIKAAHEAPPRPGPASSGGDWIESQPLNPHDLVHPARPDAAHEPLSCTHTWETWMFPLT